MSELALQTARKLDPRKIATGLGAIWALFALVGLIVSAGYAKWGLQTFNPQHSMLDLQVSSTALVTSFLLAAAAAMAFALTGVDRTRRRRKWRLAAWAFVALAVDELLGVHPWLQSEGVSWAIACLPLVVLATLALADAVTVFRSQRREQIAFAVAIAGWWAAALADLPVIDSEGGAELFAMASAIVFALALLQRLRYLARQYYPLEEHETRLSVDQIAAEVLHRLPVRAIGIALGLIVAAESIQYLFLHDPGYPHCPAVLDPCHARDAEAIGILDLNNEQTLAAAFQGFLLFGASALALVVSRLRATAIEMKRWWFTLGAVLAVLGCDQILGVHSRFGDWSGAPGQIILLPFAIAGVVAWLKVLGSIWHNRLARTLFIAGAVFWIYSQVSDIVFDASHAWTTTPEETGEATGSLLWLLSILVWMRAKLPVGLVPPEPGVARSGGHTVIKPLPGTEAPSRAPTG